MQRTPLFIASKAEHMEKRVEWDSLSQELQEISTDYILFYFAFKFSLAESC